MTSSKSTISRAILPAFISKQQGAALLGISPSTFDALRHRADFPKARFFGAVLRFNAKELEAWAQEQTARPGTPETDQNGAGA